MSTVTAWLTAFTLTQLVEVPIYAAALRDSAWIVRLPAAFGASCVTHPLVWFALPDLPVSYAWYVVVAETFAVAVEAAYLALVGMRYALVWAALANGASFSVGKLLLG